MDSEAPNEHSFDEPSPPGGDPEQGPELSATYLPYADDRLWLEMPAAEKSKRPSLGLGAPSIRLPKRRPGSPSAKKGRAVSEKSSVAVRARLARFRVALPRPKMNRGLRAGLAAAVVIVPASAFALMSSEEAGTASPIGISSPSPSSEALVVLDLEGLRAERVNSKRVVLVWDSPDRAPDEDFVYTIYRDGKQIAEVADTTFTDDRIRPKTYYYYAVTATGSGGTAATSLQLLVAVPSETGELPTEPPPAPPPPPPAPLPSPSPSTTPKPSTSPKPSNSFGVSFSLPPPTSTSSSSAPSPSPSTSPSPSPSSSPSDSPSPSPSPSPTESPSPSPSPSESPSPTTDPPSPTDSPSV